MRCSRWRRLRKLGEGDAEDEASALGNWSGGGGVSRIRKEGGGSIWDSERLMSLVMVHDGCGLGGVGALGRLDCSGYKEGMNFCCVGVDVDDGVSTCIRLFSSSGISFFIGTMS